ncbi:endo-1,4-beta-xylanase [Streptomyces sp. NPDC057684]|uniref:endo-1,4-beta-xylanase n=1 Tax=Streptomyces sp. NPDC057684 TaxID=3346211 RepID=UPI0036B7F0BA
MRWVITEPRQGQFGFAKGDVITGFARDHGRTVRGHALAWHSQLPGWVGSLPSAQVQAAMTHHITEVAGHYKDEVAAWDVVNEPADQRRRDLSYEPVLQRTGQRRHPRRPLHGEGALLVQRRAGRPPTAHGATGLRSADPASPAGWPP